MPFPVNICSGFWAPIPVSGLQSVYLSTAVCILCGGVLGFWIVLADSGVSTKHLVVLLYQLIKNGQQVKISICNSFIVFSLLMHCCEAVK